MGTKKRYIELIKDYFVQQPVVKAYFFGSVARNEDNQNSDIDILVELSEEADLFTFIQMKNQLETLLGRAVDLVSTRGLSSRIVPFIEKDKVLIYERKAS
ncbi:MAG: nucleotidyltransferase domain-containing protein [Chitinophagales bacterium]|nr:nucleotidyltransferase domain-containing protein [Chitinophagales bacterium]